MMQVRIAHELWREFDMKICSLFAHLGKRLSQHSAAAAQRNGTNVDNFVAYVGPLAIVCVCVCVQGDFFRTKNVVYD